MSPHDNQQTEETHSANSGCAGVAGSVIRVRFMVDVQSLSGVWQNVEVKFTEDEARVSASEWKEWLTKNRKTWKESRVIKETTVHEVLQNAVDQATAAKKPTISKD
jgi:hypothetical protein